MNAIAEFAPPDFVGFLRSLFARADEETVTLDDVRRRFDKWALMSAEPVIKDKSEISNIVDAYESQESGWLILNQRYLDSVIDALLKKESGVNQYLEVLDSSRERIVGLFGKWPEAKPVVSDGYVRLLALDEEYAEFLRDARWRLMAVRAKAFPSQGVGPIHGDVAGMDDYLNSVP